MNNQLNKQVTKYKFHSNGLISEKEQILHGKLVGKQIAWYSNGYLRYFLNYSNGKKFGKQIYWLYEPDHQGKSFCVTY